MQHQRHCNLNIEDENITRQWSVIWYIVRSDFMLILHYWRRITNYFSMHRHSVGVDFYENSKVVMDLIKISDLKARSSDFLIYLKKTVCKEICFSLCRKFHFRNELKKPDAKLESLLIPFSVTKSDGRNGNVIKLNTKLGYQWKYLRRPTVKLFIKVLPFISMTQKSLRTFFNEISYFPSFLFCHFQLLLTVIKMK